MKLVSRSGWDAAAPDCISPLPPIEALVVHYSAMNADEQSDHANCAGRVKAIQRYHMETNGWCDIAYNFLFCKHGYVFVGRGWNHRSGATGDANDFSIAICFLGDDTVGRNDATRAGLSALAEWLKVANTRFPGAIERGHRDYMSTACPGDELYNFVRSGAWKTFNRRVRYELWLGKERLAKSVWVRPGDGRAKVLFDRFYDRVRDTVRKNTTARKRPRFRQRWRN